MRSIYRKIAVSLMTVVALFAIASASASAAQWYVNGKALTGSAAISQTTKVEEKIELAFYSGKTLEKTIVCTGLTGVASKPFEITAPTTLKVGDFLFEGCKGTVTESGEGCKVGEGSGELGTAAVSALFSLGTSPEDHGEFAREGISKVWSEFHLSGCIIEDLEFQIDGTLPVKLPHGQTASTEQELVFEKAPGLYNFGQKSEPIYITGKVKLKLTSSSTWSLH